MDDLISRQAAIDEAYAVIVDDAVYDVVQVETLEALPSVDVVEVVRCKDCKRWNTIVDREKAEYGLCQIQSQLEATKANDYCSYGERNDG